MSLKIVIPVYVVERSNIERILDQLYVTIESYYLHNNSGVFYIYTNNDYIEININKYKKVFYRNITILRIDFEKVWKQLNLSINEIRTRREFVISKIIVPFIHDDDYLLLDWDILTTGYIKTEYIQSSKLRLFNAKFYDGISLRQNSIIRKLTPENETIGRFKWVNSGMVYSPKGLAAELIKEYWEKYQGIKEQKYKGIYLFDIIGDELIYNLMILDEHPKVEEVHNYNLNVVPRNFYFTFNDIDSMHCFGDKFPHVLNVHFAGGHIKPFDVTVDENLNLSYRIHIEKYAIDKRSLKWLFDFGEHRSGSYNYNALIFSIIWQYLKFSIKEKLISAKSDKISKRYLEFFNRNFLNE